jgi:hypothetical protein
VRPDGVLEVLDVGIFGQVVLDRWKLDGKRTADQICCSSLGRL